MKFYTSHADGFRPSLKLIESSTGIGLKYISELRQILVKYGLIAYDGKNVFIDWTRLRAFATADTRLMGKKRDWNITPMSLETDGDYKKPVHNYIGTMSSEDRRLYAIYEATAEAIADGVRFPELRSDYIVDPLPSAEKPVHNYIGDVDFINGPGVEETGGGWYTPFDESDPDWVYQVPVSSAIGNLMEFDHYNTRLPF